MNRHFDFIIAGQGLAGSLLAWFLLKRNKKVLVIDDDFPSSSSRVAAGIIHPITGRRLVKTWNADVLIPFASDCYLQIEKESASRFFFVTPILEIFTSTHHRNEWMTRSMEEDVKNYAGKIFHPDELPPEINAPLGGILINNTGWLDVKAFLNALKSFIVHNGVFINEKVSEDDLFLEKNNVRWRDVTASKIILCDGYSALTKKYFNHLPFLPAKGELVIFRSNELSDQFILNQKIFILPLGENLFKAGSTFQWNDLSSRVTEEAKQFLTKEISKMIRCDFEIINQQAAIRPTTKDRRPFTGIHPELNQLGIFNGLGTKGVIMAPYFAKRFGDYLCKDE